MNIDDSTNFGNMENEPIEDYFDGIEHSNLKRRGKISRLKFSSITEIPLVIAGIGLLVLIVLLVIFIPKNDMPIDNTHLKQMDERVQQMEERLSQIEMKIQKLANIKNQSKQVDVVMGRMNTLESDLSSRLDSVVKKIDKQQQLLEQKKTVPTKRKDIALGKSEKSLKKKLIDRYHHIRSGETLYSISRKYGLTVDQLRRLNPSIKGKSIYPGQKLRIR